MPRPSATDAIDTSIELQQRLNPTVNTSLILSSDITNSNSSSDYRQQSSSTPTRLIQQNSFSSTHSDDNTSNIQEQTNDTTTSSSNSIPIARNKNFDSMKIITTTPNISPPISPIQSLHSTSRPLMQDKSIQCIDDEDNENSIGRDGMETIDDGQIITSKKIMKRIAAYIPFPVIFCFLVYCSQCDAMKTLHQTSSIFSFIRKMDSIPRF